MSFDFSNGPISRQPTQPGFALAITFEFEPSAFSALRLAPSELARQMRTAAAVQWYAQGIVSQDEVAELAGLTRSELLEELYRRRAPACRATAEERTGEIHGR